MVVFKQYGWLGNQIFQYCALRSLMKDSETLIMRGCHQLDDLFQGTNAVFVNQYTSKIKRVCLKKLTDQIERWAERGFVQTITENNEQELLFIKGKFNKIRYSNLLFQQNEYAFAPKYFFHLSIKPDYQARSKQIVEKIKKPNSPLFFVHIRRRAYLSWKSPKSPAVLPASYYKHCIQLIRKRSEDARFIICSDDKNYIKNHFSDQSDIYLSENNYQTDFALMRLCDGGILSASSFSWWAAYYLHHKGKKGPFYAPEFWIGHRKKEWYPKYFQTSFLNYINVHGIGYSDE